MFSFLNIVILLVILLVLSFLYKRFEDKRMREENEDNYESIRKYLLNDQTSLEKIKKPILWIHVPREYNARHWLSFGSRSSFDLNQPYLYLTTKSIIDHCGDDFHICLIDDSSFSKLLPEWNINMKLLATPVLDKIRMLGLTQLLYTYGGFLMPISFLAFRNVLDLYEQGIQSPSGVFVCETVDKNATSSTQKFYPNFYFMGATKKNETIQNLSHYIQTVISTDFTSESQFLGLINKWLYHHVENNSIKEIDGTKIGVKTMDNQVILVDHLLGQNFIDLDPNAYGILIPSKDILQRTNYEWFARLSSQQVLEGNTILSKYFLLSIGGNKETENKDTTHFHITKTNHYDGVGVVEPLVVTPSDWTGFWKVPSGAPVWGMRPLNLGDDSVLKLSYPDN